MTTPSDHQHIVDEIVSAIESGEFDFHDGIVIPDHEVDRIFGISRRDERSESDPNPAA